ncbi:glycosyltransferase 61 family protein [Paracoccus spongiarum]|uniref:Glycosyltransferase family 61 protein n=1 Tax=Paracoccus spongiarum TaxID=3064387 RepID=A0ABT9JGR5_9RHOB|nr:glycosyltransferase family 61 protein [Paracoccus sp. 2205BS29-5]MDP5309023.1 glycosyltransferase family 61 protein [Paracoccus sp. 2205BS29-5]
MRPLEPIYEPALNRSIKVDARANWILRPAPAARIEMVPACESPESNDRIRAYYMRSALCNAGTAVLEVNNLPALMHHVTWNRGKLKFAEEVTLSSPSGHRFIEAVTRSDPETLKSVPRAKIGAKRFINVFANEASGEDYNLPFIVDMRNGKNYFHFLSESLSQLAVAPRALKTVYLLSRNRSRRSFVENFLATLFPEWDDRVLFLSEAVEFERAWLSYSFRLLLAQHKIPRFDRLIQAHIPSFSPRRALERRSRRALAAFTLDHGLMRLRERALIAAKGMAFAPPIPKILVVRSADPALARQRDTEGFSLLRASLRQKGFQEVVLEHLSPLEQIRLFNQASTVVAEHGAGIANMMFGSEKLHLIEIGTMQTLRFRWGDFFQMAHASQCRYTTVFTDASGEPLEIASPPQGKLAPPKIGPAALSAILDIVG